MRFARTLREVSERHLMTAAARQIAAKYDATPPPPPKGIDLFWQKIYVPAYYRLPLKMRTMVMERLPGSHRRTWHFPGRPQGPAV